MMKLATTCFIAAVAAGATLPAIAESTATVPQPKLQAIAAEKSEGDEKAAEIVQRMKAMRIPIMAFEPPKTIVDAIEFFRWASSRYDSAEIPEEERGFNFVLRADEELRANEESGASTLPSIKAADIEFYDALKLICESVDYTFYVDGSIIFVMPRNEYARQKAISATSETEERMKAMHLPEVAFEPSTTIVDAVNFFYMASKKYDLAEIPMEKRGFNMLLRLGCSKADAPVIPMLKLSDVSFYDALKLVCARVDYEFEINYEADLAKAIVTIKPCGSAKSGSSGKSDSIAKYTAHL